MSDAAAGDEHDERGNSLLIDGVLNTGNAKFLPMRLNIVSGNCYVVDVTDLWIEFTTCMRFKLLDFVLFL